MAVSEKTDEAKVSAPAPEPAPAPVATAPKPAPAPVPAAKAPAVAPPVAADKPVAAQAPAKSPAKSNVALLNFPATKPQDKPGHATPAKKPAASGIKGILGKLKIRHAVIAGSFMALVALPVAAASLYMVFIAADQYHSTASFSVRSIESGGGADILGMFTQASTGDTTSDSYILSDFIRSRTMVEAIDRDMDLDQVFARRGGDWFFSMSSGLPIEDQVDYWNSMVNVEYDHSSGIIAVTVKAFTPQDAKTIADEVVRNSEQLINELSAAARAEVVQAASNEVMAAELRLRETRRALRAYRDETQEVDPVEAARMAAELIGTLEQQKSQYQAELTTALSQMGSDSPRVRVLQSTLASIEAQIASERRRLGSGLPATEESAANGGGDVASRIQRYEELETEREFAERTYTSALGSLESARQDAARKQRYLAVFGYPTLSQAAQYPQRGLAILLVLLGSLFVWAIGVMGYYNIKDRA